MESGTADRIAATGKTAGLKLLKTCASSMAIIFLFYCQSSAAEKSKGSQIELLSASQMNKIPLMVHVYGIGEKESETLKQEIETIIKKAGRAVISDCCAEDYYNEFHVMALPGNKKGITQYSSAYTEIFVSSGEGIFPTGCWRQSNCWNEWFEIPTRNFRATALKSARTFALSHRVYDPAGDEQEALKASLENQLKDLQLRSNFPFQRITISKGFIVELSSGQYQAIPGSRAESAGIFVRKYASLLGLDTGERKIQLTQPLVEGARVYFPQTWHGLPVFDGGLSVWVDCKGRVHQVMNQAVFDFQKTATTPRISPAQALESARRDPSGKSQFPDWYFKGSFLRPLKIKNSPELGVYSSRLAYRFKNGAFVYFVDASSAEILAECSNELIEAVLRQSKE